MIFCTYSMIMDHFYEKWNQPPPTPQPPSQPVVIHPVIIPMQPQITPEEIAEFKKLLERARKYDSEHNQPECENEQKIEQLKQLAKELNIELPI